MKSAVVLFSGGMDSTVLAYKLHLRDNVEELHLLSFDYGQRHRTELQYARRTASALNATHHIVDLSTLTPVLSAGGSVLTSPDAEIPHGHYAADNMKATVVPNRNMIMLAVAGAYASALGLEAVATAVHGGDHFIYPDCRPEFIAAMQAALIVGLKDHGEPELFAPFVRVGKEDIARLGEDLRVPWNHTWSCYEGRAFHCGKCGTCVERKEAFELAGVEDPTEYVDG